MVEEDLTRRDQEAEDHRQRTRALDRASFGQVMTPSDVALFMARELDVGPSDRVLDPATGLGILSHAVLCEDPELASEGLTCLELDSDLADELRSDSVFEGADVVEDDFLTWGVEQLEADRRWDGIIANPPYLNFHDFDRGQVDLVNRALGTDLSKLTNIYALFILLGTRLLASGGRMVFITPTELFSTNYGTKTLSSLPDGVRLRKVVVFEPDAEPFDEAETTACITVFERGGSETDAVDVLHVAERGASPDRWGHGDVRTLPWEAVEKHPKRVLRAPNETPEMDGVPRCRLGDLVNVSRGIATGANKFFTIPPAKREELDPEGDHTVPVISRASSLGRGLSFDEERFQELVEQEERCWLLYLDGDEELPPKLQAYIREGEARGLDGRYLCEARSTWYAMEQQAPPLAFVRVFGRDGVLVLVNEMGVRTLACCHRIYHHSPQRIEDRDALLLACFLRSPVGHEMIERQSRRYGDGLWKAEPNDLEEVEVPDIRLLSPDQRGSIDAMATTRFEEGEDTEEICEAVTARLLDELREASGEVELAAFQG